MADDEAWWSDEEADAGPQPVQDPEVWMDHYSEELLDLWYGLKEAAESRGLAVLDACAFPDFAQFCYQHSSGYPPTV